MYRYIGNKTKVLSSLLPILTKDLLENSVVADLMCGTASVSSALRSVGHQVIAADVLTFACNHARTRLLFDRQPEFLKLGCSYNGILSQLNSLPGIESYFFEEYSPGGQPGCEVAPRKYLTINNAMKLDAVSELLTQWQEDGSITEAENWVLRNDLVLAVNRIANIAGTYGHFRSTFSTSAEQPLTLRPFDFHSRNPFGHRVIQGHAEDIAKGIVADLVYLDPPYKKRQYAANYHLLETVAVGDKAAAYGVSGLRDWWPQYSDFCSKLKIEKAFDDILEGVCAPRVMVSYSEDGLIPLTQLSDFLAKHGEIAVHSFEHKRFRSNQSPLPAILNEYVIEVIRK